MSRLFPVRPERRCIAVLMLAALSGCGTFNPATRPQPAFYSLDSLPPEQPVSRIAASVTLPTLIVNPTHAASGLDSKHIIYVRQAHQPERYAHSEWNDTPARMLTPLVITTIARRGAFRAVVPTPSAAAGELRLDSEIIRLQLDAGTSPGRVRFTLRSYLVDNTTRKVLAWREFDERVVVPSEDPRGTVIAANQAVRAALAKLADFCIETAARWQLQVPDFD